MGFKGSEVQILSPRPHFYKLFIYEVVFLERVRGADVVRVFSLTIFRYSGFCSLDNNCAIAALREDIAFTAKPTLCTPRFST